MLLAAIHLVCSCWSENFMRKLIVGNWKMNGLLADLDEIGVIAASAADYPSVDSGLCLPTLQ